MIAPRVTVFFYGSYINPKVLREVDLVPERIEVARLPGYDITIRPLANLVPSDRHTVYGILADATHDELERLYAHARLVLGGHYLPHPVLAFPSSGGLEPALCYIAPALEDKAPTPDYVGRILAPAREHGFPDWYVEHLGSFLEGGAG